MPVTLKADLIVRASEASEDTYFSRNCSNDNILGGYETFAYKNDFLLNRVASKKLAYKNNILGSCENLAYKIDFFFCLIGWPVKKLVYKNDFLLKCMACKYLFFLSCVACKKTCVQK